MPSVNLLGVLTAAVVGGMGLGFLWYGPLFGKHWLKLVGMTEEKMKAAMKEGMAKVYGISFFAALVLAYFTGALVKMMGATTVVTGAQVGFMIWLGFVATTHISSYLYENKSMKLYKLNMGYFLVQLLVMGGILALWG